MAELTWNAVETIAIRCKTERTFHFDLDSIRELVFKLSYALTLDYTLAEDLAQDSLIKIWQHRGRLAELEYPEAWIAKVVTNKARSYWRRRTKWFELPKDTPAPGENDPVLIELKSMIADLNVEQREVVLLVAVYGFTYPEAAEALGIPEGTVSSRYSTAKKLLQDRMGEK